MGKPQIMDVEGINEMMEIIALFFGNCKFRKCTVIVEIGNILLESKGKNIYAEMILLSLLVSNKNDPKSLLFNAVSHLEGKERDALINEIMEDCYAFLSIYLEEMQQETRDVIYVLNNNPPHPGFLRAVNDKINGLKKTI